MPRHLHALPYWSTASFGDSVQPVEVAGLSEHYGSCQGAQGPLFTLRCMAEAAHRFIAVRLVTTLVLATSLIGTALLVM